MEAVGIEDALVEDYFLLLAFFVHFESYRVGVLFGFVRIVPGDGSLFLKRFGDFVDDVAFE